MHVGLISKDYLIYTFHDASHFAIKYHDNCMHWYLLLGICVKMTA